MKINTGHTRTTESGEAEVALPTIYIKGLAEKIQRPCRKLEVQTVFRSSHTLRQILSKVKNPIPEASQKEVVHQIPCQDWDSVYVGETGRTLEKRINEGTQVCRED